MDDVESSQDIISMYTYDGVLKARMKQQEAISNIIESPKYCAECGEEIPEKRRKAIPGIKLCVTCAENLYG